MTSKTLGKKNAKVQKLTKTLNSFQDELFDLTQNVTQDKNQKINNDEFLKILRFYGMLDDFVLNIESLKREVGEFCLSKN